MLEMYCCTLSTGCSPDNLCCCGWGCPASVVCALLVGGLCGGRPLVGFGRCVAMWCLMVWVSVSSTWM